MIDVHDDALLTELDHAAKTVAFRYERWVSKEALYEEAFAWVLRHPLLAEKLMTEGALRRQVQDHLRLVGQKEWAAQSGFHVDDVEYYSPRMVAALLPAAMDMEEAHRATAQGDDATAVRPTTWSPIRTPTTDAERLTSFNLQGPSDFICSLVDIKNAWINTSLFGYEKDAIRLRYVEDLNWFEVADRLGVELEDAKRAVAVGLRRLCNFLGGFRGRSCPADCPDCTQRLVDED